MKRMNQNILAVTTAFTVGAVGGYAANGPEETTQSPQIEDEVSTIVPLEVTPDHDTQVTELNTRLLRAQESLTAISAVKMKEFIDIVEKHGSPTGLSFLTELDVTAADGTEYTNYVFYGAQSGDEPRDVVTRVMVGVLPAGRAEGSGYSINDGHAYNQDEGITTPLDGTVDMVSGYLAGGANRIWDLSFAWPDLSDDLEHVTQLEAAGPLAQEQYAAAVDETLSQY